MRTCGRCARARSAAGFVFHKAADASKAEPELGRMTQKANGKWEWERVPQTWVCYPYRGANRTTKLDARQLLTLFSDF